jgi:hypothetical protein
LGLDKSNIRMTISRARDCYQRNWHWTLTILLL